MTRLYLPRDSDAYRFALLVWEGYNYADACREMGVDIERAKNWRQSLVRRASREAGRDVTYCYAVRMVMIGANGKQSAEKRVRG